MHKLNMSRRSFIRLISFLMAGVIALGIMSLIYYRQNIAAKRHIEYGYLRSLEHLSINIDNIKNSLNKGLYSNSSQMLNDISGRLYSDASAAKMSLSQLPVTELNLENTNRFLSQVGNFSSSLARRHANGEQLTSKDRDDLNALLEHAKKLSDELWGIENMVAGGHLNFEKVVNKVSHIGESSNYPAHVSDGFGSLEGLFDDYPSLVYDGPFSEHLQSKNPLLLQGKEIISKEQSLETAIKAAGVDSLEFASDQGGRMPSFSYADGNTTVSVTQAGGYLAYTLKHRQIGEKAISTDKAVSLAEQYLASVGYENMVHTYYELNGGICTINFAGLMKVPDRHTGGEAEVTVYTDLIKVGVAVDNGEIMTFDARGYISSHHMRFLDGAEIPEDEARSKVSPQLEIQNAKLAIVPSAGEHERFCYEFLCTTKLGGYVLVYINADTGHEEKILLMRISDNGTLIV